MDSPPATLRVELTAEDVAAGVAYRPDACPITLAAERATGLPCRTLRATLVVGDTEYQYALPYEAREFVWQFDLGRNPAPIAFEAQRVPPGQRRYVFPEDLPPKPA